MTYPLFSGSPLIPYAIARVRAMTARQAAILRLRQNFFRSPRLFHPLTGVRLRADSSDMVIPAEDFPRIFRTPARALLFQLEPVVAEARTLA